MSSSCNAWGPNGARFVYQTDNATLYRGDALAVAARYAWRHWWWTA